jgi:hypothetical protein
MNGYLIYVPQHLTRSIITLQHSTNTAGHPGKTITKRKLKMRFFWNSLSEDVEKFIDGCEVCARRKLQKGSFKAISLPNEIQLEPFQQISIDIVGPLKRTKRGNINILTAICNATRFAIATPIPDAKALTVAKALIENVFLKHGFPAKIVSDNGSHFVNKLMNSIIKHINAKHHFTIPYHPQSNGRIERFHRSLHDLIALIMASSPTVEEWDEYIPYALFAYNNNPRDQLPAPYTSLTGRICADPTTATLNIGISANESQSIVALHKFNIDRCKAVIESIEKKTMEERMEGLKKIPNIKIFEEGQRVWLAEISPNKHEMKHKEAIVTKRIGLVRYIVETKDRNPSGNVVRHVRSAHVSELHENVSKPTNDRVEEILIRNAEIKEREEMKSSVEENQVVIEQFDEQEQERNLILEESKKQIDETNDNQNEEENILMQPNENSSEIGEEKQQVDVNRSIQHM